VNQALRSLTSAGLVVTRYGRIQVLDLNGLRQRVLNPPESPVKGCELRRGSMPDALANFRWNPEHARAGD
jgi:hypothetical protein